MSAVEMKLPENLTISQAHALHDEFEALFNREHADQLVIDAEGVARADTAGLQLLLAVVNLGKERHMAVSFDKPSEKLVEVANTLGLHAALGFH